MKLAISGKGGTGKSTLSAALALMLSAKGWKVLAVDADPDGNLAAALGASPADLDRIVPISKQKELIEERTGAKVKQYGQMFKLNPEVSDIADGYGTKLNGVTLLVLGAIEAGGSGCACPESVLIRALVSDLVLHRKDALIMDMEAGIEHLGRATAKGVDTLLVMVEPSQRAIDSARRVARLAGEIGLRDIRFVANKIASLADEQFVRSALSGQKLAGSIPWSEAIRSAERAGRPVLEGADGELLRSFESLLGNLPARGSSAVAADRNVRAPAEPQTKR
jgi:CO dehydrogenase maturation factor